MSCRALQGPGGGGGGGGGGREGGRDGERERERVREIERGERERMHLFSSLIVAIQ